MLQPMRRCDRRLCLVLPHAGFGGGEAAMVEVARGLAREFALEVCALDPRREGSGSPLGRALGDRLGAVGFLARRWQLRPRLAAVDAVVWYGVSNAVPKVLAALAATGGRPASLRVVHTSRPADGPRFHRRWRRVIDATVCVVPGVARRIPGAAFIPNPCPRGRLTGRRRELFPAASGRKTLGFLGRLQPLKNVRWLIENLAALDCNLALQAFDGEQLTAANLCRLAAELGVVERVRFLPPGRDVGSLLRSVDALVVASSHEGFPMVVVEAGAAGTPVLATPVGALPELFADEVLFVEFAAGDGTVPSVESLRRAIAAVGPAHGARLRAKVLRLCDPETVVARYADLLRDLIDRSRVRRETRAVRRPRAAP